MVCAPVWSIIHLLRDRAWFVHLYVEMSLCEWIIDHTGAQTMLYLTCTIISSVDLAHYRVSRDKDWVSGHCSTIIVTVLKMNLHLL